MRHYAIICVILLSLAGCSLFSTREPDAPMGDSGTFLQPDTPEQVVENLQAAIAEMNTLNYRRSLADDMAFHPTATAQATDAIWSGWTRTHEEAYFNSMSGTARTGAEHSLALADETVALLSETRYSLDARYVLTVEHGRVAVPTQVQGQLFWIIEQGADGLWRLVDWTDRELGSQPSWSDLKAAFSK